MDEQQAAEICAAFALGAPSGSPDAVPGGRLHRVWRLTTTAGRYAVKQLNPALLRAPGAAERFRATERIAAAATAGGVPAVAALSGPDGPLWSVTGACVMVYPWIDGATLPPTPAGPARGRRIGALLGRLHGLGLTTDGLAELAWETDALRDDGWVLLARRGAARGLPWGEPLRALRHDLALWAMRARQAIAELYRVQVVSHRDMDQRNVLWRDAHSPAIIDWETAGLTHPTVELADVALNWSGILTGSPDEATFAAVVAGYRAAGGTIQAESRDVLYTVLNNWLGWLRYNLRRTLGEDAAGPEEQDVGMREAQATLVAVRALAANIETWGRWINAGK
jgi:Ser/Thr protein kinase RdoA (MazF antagonist)